jgi:glycerol-3-phosphate O-acyltransferase
MSDFAIQLDTALSEGMIDAKFQKQIFALHDHFQRALSHSGIKKENSEKLFSTLISLVLENCRHPHSFSIFHESVREPFDYYKFGLDFIRLFVDDNKSILNGIESIQQIEQQLNKNENVILFANHQIEADPQIISLLLEKVAPELAVNMIFVAGHRVITDPMAIPMSLGRNLLCIYSKKHMSHPPEEKANKISHNQKTLKKLQELLNKGGQCIYVAPSGGRDRPDESGNVHVSAFDPQSIELFWLMGKHSSRPTHFYPLALHTYPLMPPPNIVEKEIGERRILNISPVHAYFGKEIDMEGMEDRSIVDKKAKREKRAADLTEVVQKMYVELG